MSTDNQEIMPAAENSAGEVKPMPTIKPTVGRVVYYKLNQDDSDQINKRRKDYQEADKTINTGFQAHVGNSVSAGQIFPMIVVAVWGEECINGKVLLDGNDDYWATSVQKGEDEHEWDWMPFQKDQQARLAK